jgi:predicted HTH transcriptional regulator
MGAVKTKMDKLRIFVSSVQKELEDERLIVQNLVNTDLFLSAHCTPILYEMEPASPERAAEGCLATVDGCQVYLLIIGIKYGEARGGRSITHEEYRRAKAAQLPVLAFIKGERSLEREAGTSALLAELDADGFKYKRFGNIIDLQREVRAAIVQLLQHRFGITPTTDEDEIARQTIEATSPFESQPVDRLRWEDLDRDVLRRLLAAAEGRDGGSLSEEELLAGAKLRGLVWEKPGEIWLPAPGDGFGDGQALHRRPDEYFATAAGIVLLAQDPSAVFPQCRILADAYRSTEADGAPRDHEDIRGPMPTAVDRALAFVDRNSRHPMRVVGLNRVRLDEYPTEALREALVNAVAHRQYEDAGRKIMLEVFADRVVVSSPGLPPAPITIASLRKGRYRPCSRNPVLSHRLSYFHRIEERGSGFRRMRDQMLDHGLDEPRIGSDPGYFQIVFLGPGDNIERIRAPKSQAMVTPAVEAQLNDRQKEILRHVLKVGLVTRRWCVSKFRIANDTAGRDLKGLTNLRILVAEGKGRAVRYVMRGPAGPTENRPK